MTTAHSMYTAKDYYTEILPNLFIGRFHGVGPITDFNRRITLDDDYSGILTSQIYYSSTEENDEKIVEWCLKHIKEIDHYLTNNETVFINCITHPHVKPENWTVESSSKLFFIALSYLVKNRFTEQHALDILSKVEGCPVSLWTPCSSRILTGIRLQLRYFD